MHCCINKQTPLSVDCIHRQGQFLYNTALLLFYHYLISSCRLSLIKSLVGSCEYLGYRVAASVHSYACTESKFFSFFFLRKLRIAFSYPPNRAIRSFSPIFVLTAYAKCLSTSSPKTCPYVSFTDLNKSRSISTAQCFFLSSCES